MAGVSLPRIYGDPVRLRTKLGERVRRGQHLADELGGVRDRLEDPAVTGLGAVLVAEMALSPVEQRVGEWQRGNRQLLATHLGREGERVLPWPDRDKGSGELSPAGRLDALAANIRGDLRALAGILQLLPTRRGVGGVISRAVTLDEVWASGLIDGELLRSYEQRMSSVGTRAAARAAIGASKELVETILKVTLDRLEQPVGDLDEEFLVLGRRARRALAARVEQTAPDRRGRDALDRGLAGILQSLNELRNLYGTGHGALTMPERLAPRHGRLAVDLALTLVRFIVSTLDDLALLPQPFTDDETAPMEQEQPAR